MITIVSGTNRKNSVSKKLAHIYQGILQSKGVATELIYLEDLPDDFTETALYDQSGKNEVFNIFRKQMLEAEKMVFIVPEYNGSFPGVLKAFIDGLAFPHTFRDKKAALVGISSGVQGGGLALSHLTDIFNYCGTHVLAQKPKLARIEANLTENKLSQLYHDLLEEQVDKLLAF
ncbi:NAD(P)H-dependent oxidoreductase [Reichenbachiella carrageenanivorans]|uniref:NAD(P)H-dependent oxidoreductase n=1 Tax=Reichenbachiella carrageenanivorans TaxID=2979869 RepID=A0ABY6CUW8_9BACT|nr:NAD(P)H-dependent oxidoreductase [Reichenbachiella carrageenanivorans]UXX77717.1 NAD(P)H-dependent oxidoreductase [Reichenbachiella carrageenanivorans]